MKYKYENPTGYTYRYKRIQLSSEGEAELRRWREKSEAKLRAEFPEYFAELDRRKQA